MKNLYKSLLIAGTTLFCGMNISAQNRADVLFPAGDGTPWGWTLDEASALTAKPETPNIFEGTLYLQADKDLKFLKTFDFGNDEFRAVVNGSKPDASGKVALMLNGDDNKFRVAESANYHIVVDADALTATIKKSPYQDANITLSSMFIVGAAAPNGWDIDHGTAMHQDAAAPYIYSATTELKTGDFKLATVLKGARSWNKKYWIFRDATDDGKIVPASDEDNKWNITDPGTYTVTVNTKDNTISISKTGGIEDITADSDIAPVYYNLQGVRVSNPDHGQLLIRVAGDKATKIIY